MMYTLAGCNQPGGGTTWESFVRENLDEPLDMGPFPLTPQLETFEGRAKGYRLLRRRACSE